MCLSCHYHILSLSSFLSYPISILSCAPNEPLTYSPIPLLCPQSLSSSQRQSVHQRRRHLHIRSGICLSVHLTGVSLTVTFHLHHPNPTCNWKVVACCPFFHYLQIETLILFIFFLILLAHVLFVTTHWLLL
jgi:hypothetical protein